MEDRVKSAFSFRIKELQKHHAALHNRYNSRGKEAFAQQRYGEYYAERIRTEISNRFTRHTAKQSTSHKQSDRNRISDYTGLRSRTRVSVVRCHRSDQLSGTKRYYNRLPRSADRYQRQYGKALASGSAESSHRSVLSPLKFQTLRWFEIWFRDIRFLVEIVGIEPATS